jgi:hypothetical protein
MKHKSGYAILSAVLALTLAGLACSGGNAAPTSAPTASNPTASNPTRSAATVAVPTQAAPTQASKATAVPTQVAKSTATKQSTSAPTKAATATKAPLSGSLDVHGIASYLDNDKYYHVMGLVTNGTNKPVSNIQVSIQLTDSAGKTVLQDNSGNPTSTVSINTILSTLDSGESSPFDYNLSTSGTDTTGWKFDVKLASNETPSSLQRVQIDVVNDLMTVNSSGAVYLTGELVNKSDKPAQISGFAGAMLDGADMVVGANGSTTAADLLAPAGDASGSDRTPFVISIIGPIKAGAKPAYYVDGVAGDPTSIAGAADVQLKLETSFVDADNGVHVVATVNNSGTNTMTVQVVAGLYDQAGKVLDADSISPPIYLAPGESSPVPFYYFENLNGNGDLVNKIVSDTVQIDPYWTFPSTTEFVALKASNVTTATSGTSVTIKGDVVNTSNKSLNGATIVVSIHDANGKLVAADWTTASPSSGAFAPKAKLSWSVDTQLPTSIDANTLTFDTIVQANVHQ